MHAIVTGGHYAPIVSEYFVQQNAMNVSGAHNINLQHVLIGNGWYDPLIQYQAYYNFTVSPGNTYNYDPFNQSVKGKNTPDHKMSRHSTNIDNRSNV
jgi:hypothetical protein